MGAEAGRDAGRRRYSSRLGMRLAVAFVVVAGILTQSAAALADTATIPSTPDPDWATNMHQTPIELLASRIASHIAGRTVNVRCNGASAWTDAVQATGGVPSAESGFVSTSWNSATGQLIESSNVAELNGASICLPLQAFAEATTKPTKCSSTPAASTHGFVERYADALQRASAHSPRPVAARRGGGIQPGPCVLTSGAPVRPMPESFWTGYDNYAIAILTLAHESIHLGGAVGGRLANGLNVGDPQAEAKADCYGMQWMPYVAEQLGDTPTDAQAIADYFLNAIYPQAKTSSSPQYWSPTCKANGTLDLHLAGTSIWS